MSDAIKHECGLAMIRLRKPLSYYRRTYGSATWGLDKLQLLMIKQRNRGQDGAGVAAVKLDVPMGDSYIFRRRSVAPDPAEDVFRQIHERMGEIEDPGPDSMSDDALKRRYDFVAEAYLAHLRYGTHGDNTFSACHPHVRPSNWASANLVVAGNFNLTNSSEIFAKLVGYGLRPVGTSDTATVLEKIGHFLDEENDRLRRRFAEEEGLSGPALAARVSAAIDIAAVLREASKAWDGGWTLAGLIGNGDAWVWRDPHGIRPAFYYVDEEVVAVASERAALTTVFNVGVEAVRSVTPGHVLSMRYNGEVSERTVATDGPVRMCTFERIYFSRGNDPAIYEERKALGRELARPVLEVVKWDVERTVFSYIPNTAETAFLGLVQEVEREVRHRNADELWKRSQAGTLTRADVDRLLNDRIRVEKAAHKDQKVRTFIAQDRARRDLVKHVYDITRGVCRRDDTLVVLDDSIVRGTTLRDSIVTMLSRLEPRRIVVASSAPPIKYPDCYGIDMSQLGAFVAFQAAVAIRRERGEGHVIEEVYRACKAQAGRPVGEYENHVARVYEGIGDAELSRKVAELVRPTDVEWDGELVVLYQSVEGLRRALPEHLGDWYFTGEYPTPGGYKVLNTAFLNYFENRGGRSY